MSGPELSQYVGLVAFAHEQPVAPFALPGASGTSNQRWMSLMLAWITGRGPRDADKRVLAIALEQTTRSTARRRGGLGVVEGLVEGYCLDHHGQYHLLALLCGIKHALATGDEVALEALLRVLAGWLALYADFSLADGQTACAGWRAWPYRPEGGVQAYLARITAPDGWHHADAGGTLSVAADTVWRAWRGLPQLDNRRSERNSSWMLKNRADSGSWQPAILLQRLIDGERLRERVDLDLLGELGDDAQRYVYPIGLQRTHLAGGGFEVRMAADPKTVAPGGWGAAPAVRLLPDANPGGHRNRVSWYPLTLP